MSADESVSMLNRCFMAKMKLELEKNPPVALNHNAFSAGQPGNRLFEHAQRLFRFPAAQVQWWQQPYHLRSRGIVSTPAACSSETKRTD